MQSIIISPNCSFWMLSN